MPRPPRFEIRSQVLHDLRLSGGARLVYMLLDDLGWMDGSVELTQDEIGDRLGMPSRTVERHLAELRATGKVEVKRGGPRAGRYLLLWHRPATHGGSKPPRPATHGGSEVQVLADQGAIKSLGNQRDKNSIQRADEVESVREWLDSYPGAKALGCAAPIEIARRCLDSGTYLEVTGELRAMAHREMKPASSWGWFPVVLAQRLARSKQA